MSKLIALLALLLVSFQAHSVCSTESCQSYQADFRTLIDSYRGIYCYTATKQTEYNKNFEQLAADYANRLHDSMTMDDYVWLLRSWAGEFHDGHVNFMPQKFGRDFRVTKFDIALTLLEPATAQETLIVAASKDTRIPVGSIVNTINGRPALEVVADIAHYSSGSTERMRRLSAGISALSALTYLNNSADHQLSIAKPNSETQDILIKGERSLFSSSPSPQDPKTTVTTEILPEGILRLNISQFVSARDTIGTDEEFQNAIRNIDLTQIKGIVLDLRRNRGGSTEAYEKILGHFTNTALNTYKVSPRITPITKRERPALAQWPLIPNTDFGVWRTRSSSFGNKPALNQIPLITLISPYCFSACDTLVATLKGHRIGTIVGEPTGGGTGTPIVFELPQSSHQFRYSTIRGKSLDDKFIEGVGTQPDIYIPQTVKDIRDQMDYQLQAAIAYFSPNTLSSLHRLPLRTLTRPEVNPLHYSAETYELYLRSAAE